MLVDASIREEPVNVGCKIYGHGSTVFPKTCRGWGILALVSKHFDATDLHFALITADSDGGTSDRAWADY